MSIGKRLATWLAMGAFLSVLIGETPAFAQRSVEYRLSKVKSLKCAFSLYVTGNWKDGEAHAELKPAKLALQFDDIDTDEGTARAIGMFGPTHMIARLAVWSLHFMEIGSSGTLNITTVFDKESRAGRLKAVHTRHEYTDVSLPGFTSRPEQYYGDCEIVQ
jgi:hypothetical protein